MQRPFPNFARNKIWKCAWVPILTIYIGLGLLTCHLQAYVSQMQTPFSIRKGNLPKRSFPEKNLGYGSSIAIPLAVCQKPDQMPYTVDFLGINNWNHTYTSWHYPFSVEPTQGCHKSVLGLMGGWELPDQCLQNLCQHWKAWRSLLFGTPFFWAQHITLMITQAKKLLKHRSLITKMLMTTIEQQLNTWVLCLNEFLASLVLGCTYIPRKE